MLSFWLDKTNLYLTNCPLQNLLANPHNFQLYIYLVMKAFLVLSLLIVAMAISPEPIPSCSRPDITLKDLPISPNEMQTYNLNDIFKGYNINYTLIGQPSWAQLRPKFDLQKSQKLPQPGLKSFHLDHVNNHWGSKLVTVSDAANSTIVRWGSSSVLDAIPTVNNTATVESDPKILCFDAIWLNHTQLIIVDCVRQGNYALQNIFLYLNSTTQKVIQKQVVNDMWIGYTTITRRKIVHYIEDGEHYLFRAYFADAVNQEQRHNTYAEILLFNDPFRPWAIKVLDRSFLGQDALSITDFKEYLGDLYILDYHKGVISFDITPSQNIVIKGRYRTDSGFQKMGIYSNNLADEVLLALANEHGIYQIDWTNQIRPTIIAKYSLMEGSRIRSLWVNEEYIACQLRANVTNSTNQTEEYHSTIVFDRGTRTYTNAYAVIHHSSYRALLDLNIQHSALLSIDEDSIDTYYIDEPYLFLWPQDQKDLGKEFNFTVKAESKNEKNGQTLVCTFDWRFVVVKADSLALWPTGIPTPINYYANFPGELTVPLTRYVIGANITYGISQKSLTNDSAVPNHWIYQQNDTIIHWKKEPSMFKYTFLRKEQFEYMNKQYFFIYSQDSANVTHIAQCQAAPYSKDIYCKENSKFQPINFKINNFTATAFLPHYGEWLHLVATVYQEFPNEVFIYNVQDKMDTFHSPIVFEKGWEGKVQSIEFLGHYLVVVLRHIKTLVFYDMKQCYDQQGEPCKEIYRVDSIMMDKLGVPYFSPLDVYTSDFHPFVLFIQNVNSVIILDITKNGPILLQQIESPASKQPGFWKWKMAISRGHLVIVNPPNLIEEYQLNELYTRKITQMTKQFPVYNYTILDSFDLDAADNSDMVYITGIDNNLPANKNTVIMVYRTNTASVAAFYDIWHVEGKYDEMLLDVTGVHGDYVTVAMGSILMTFRQYGVPVLIFEDNWNDFEFNVTYTNDPEHRYNYTSYATVKVANYPEKIIINDTKLNQTDYLTNAINYQQQRTEVVLDDSTWFNGTVLNYTVEGCSQCGNKIKVVGHLQEKRDFLAQTDMEDYVFTRDGGVVQQFQSLIKMKHNGSIDQVVSFPSILDGEHCTHIQHSWIYDYTLSACEHLGEIYLYTTTYTSFKPFVNGPFYSGAKYVSGLHIMEDILVLVDVEDNPQNMNHQGGILIMAMNHDPFDPEMFDLVEVIGDDDLQHAVNWPGGHANIGSAQLLFTNQTSLYRLVITETRHGLFFVDFKFTKGRKSIEITKVEFVDLNKLMVSAGLHMPNLAFFWGVAVPIEYYNTQFNYWQYEIVVTTTKFHTLKFDFHIDKSGTILQSESKLSKVFYRYGYYDVAGFIRHFDGYFAIIHNLPASLQPFEQMSRKVLSLYDTRERWVFNQTTQKMEPTLQIFYENTTVPASYMMGGMRFRKGRLAYDFNVTLTRNRTDPFRDISLLVLHDREAMIRQVLIHDHIKIIAEADIKGDQHGFLKANSDFNSVAIPLRILGIDEGLSGGAIAGIIIGSILVVVGLGYLAYRWNLKRKRADGTGLEESLIERETLNIHKDDDADDDQSDDDQDDDQDGEDDEEQDEENDEKEPQKQVQPVPAVTLATAEQYPEIEQKPKSQERQQGAVKE